MNFIFAVTFHVLCQGTRIGTRTYGNNDIHDKNINSTPSDYIRKQRKARTCLETASIIVWQKLMWHVLLRFRKNFDTFFSPSNEISLDAIRKRGNIRYVFNPDVKYVYQVTMTETKKPVKHNITESALRDGSARTEPAVPSHSLSFSLSDTNDLLPPSLGIATIVILLRLYIINLCSGDPRGITLCNIRAWKYSYISIVTISQKQLVYY